MCYIELLFGNLTAVDPWLLVCPVRSQCIKREEYFVCGWDITTPLPLCRLQSPYSWHGLVVGFNAVATGVDPYPYLS